MFEDRRWGLFKRNLQPTLTLWSAFCSFGLCMAFLGPTLLDLRCQTHSSLKQITWVFFAQNFCVLVGTIIGGLFKKTFSCSLTALFISTLMISAVFSIIPFCNNVLILAFVLAVAGLAMGCIDTIANLQLVRIYQKDSPIFLQVLHFCVGFGAFLSPMIADPFLSETNCMLTNLTANGTSADLAHIRNSLAHPHLVNGSDVFLEPNGIFISNVSYAFWIMALINLPVPVAVLSLMCKQGFGGCCRRKKSPLLPAEELPSDLQMDRLSMGSEKTLQEKDPDSFSSCLRALYLQESPCTFVVVHIVGATVLFMSDGILGEYSGFVYTYAVEKPLYIEPRVAGYLNSLFWASITLGRLASIPVSGKLRPATMVFINLGGIIGTFVLMLCFPVSIVCLYVGTGLLGFFLSSTFPSMLAYTEDILNYQGCATTVLVTGAGVGEFVLQMLVGSVIQSPEADIFLVCGLTFGCLALLFYLVLLLVHRLHNLQSMTGPSKTPTIAESQFSYQS
ncbi:major facilitator superfamily domain-containing protein 4A [Amblyraja radiata]|uniref:major facilitator superfamily domain-containing protein 4A n=1 Tax=Amblyraja radiata TaxID=386614 RepID=UPI00140279C8|nr:major facilitator superfamily domain-containing protein 4A [Amblyraja radiata]